MTDPVACKQQRFLYYSSGGWDSEIRVPAWSGESLSWIADFLYLHMAEWARELHGVSSIRALIPSMRTLPS